ncbi:phytanoyl-CoA dioxygenase family protein [Kiloniella laminariae]|uniref:phytanoyl-CoA dioxygenase family protein n=1 Tax=Kiloniella laminariae TaxID=454162 RepID=UPI00037E0727|nr:phytanoyl-CoA dioxygenase family protein [Kiloniella laminariae]
MPSCSLPPECRDLGFWRKLNPELSITNTPKESPALPGIDEPCLEQVSDTLWQDGYLSCPELYPESELAPLRQAMTRLQQHNLPQAFIYLYDEVWQLFLRARPLLSHYLGDQYRILPHFWAWYIEAGKGTGWPPHRDSADQSVINLYGQEMLVSLSLWLPLTDATLQNGCMSILPKSCENTYEPLLTDQGQIRLQDALALPAKAGSLLGWRQDLYHWGGRSHRTAQGPRLSLSLEFQNAALDPLCEPLIDPQTPPPPEARLELVLKQLEKYLHMEKS